MADPYKSNITTLAKRLKPFFMKWMQTYINNEGGDGVLLKNKIYRFDYGTETVEDYDGDDAGLTAALAASSSGDIVWVLAHEITGAHTIPAGVEVVGLGQENTTLTGTITLDYSSTLSMLSVIVSGSSAEYIAAIIGPTTGEARLHEVHVNATNTGAGDTYEIVEREGTIYMEGGWLEGGRIYKLYEGSGVLTVIDARTIPETIIDPEFYPEPDETVFMEITGERPSMQAEYLDRPDGTYRIYYRVEYYVAYTGLESGFFSSIVYDVESNIIDSQKIDIAGTDQLAGSYGGHFDVTWDTELVAKRVYVHFDSYCYRVGGNYSITIFYTASLVPFDQGETGHAVYTSAVRMDPVIGVPVLGDRGAYDVDNWAERHASDIANETWEYHNDPNGPPGGGIYLDDLLDVDVFGVQDGQTLVYDGLYGGWYADTPLGSGDMTKSVYDTDDDGVVDEAESVPWSGVTDPPATYEPSAHEHVEADITDLDHTDADAIHDNVAGEISAVAEKEAPDDDDVLLIEDSEASYVKKKVKISNLPAGSGGSTFIGLTDTPENYTDQAGKYVIVNETEDGLDFIDAPSGGGFLVASNYPGGFIDLGLTLTESSAEVP